MKRLFLLLFMALFTALCMAAGADPTDATPAAALVEHKNVFIQFLSENTGVIITLLSWWVYRKIPTKYADIIMKIFKYVTADRKTGGGAHS